MQLVHLAQIAVGSACPFCVHVWFSADYPRGQPHYLYQDTFLHLGRGIWELRFQCLTGFDRLVPSRIVMVLFLVCGTLSLIMQPFQHFRLPRTVFIGCNLCLSHIPITPTPTILQGWGIWIKVCRHNWSARLYLFSHTCWLHRARSILCPVCLSLGAQSEKYYLAHRSTAFLAKRYVNRRDRNCPEIAWVSVEHHYRLI